LDKDDACPNQKGQAEYRGCPSPTHRPLGSQMISLYDSLLFETGKADISLANQQRIHSFAQRMMTENKNYNIMLIGHTDNVEKDSASLYNLSVQRAEAVRQALIKEGVQEQRITVDGYGDAQPAGNNANPILRKFNRRVQLFIEVVGE
jgi:outer membrane protein OmpA-like peptidoglycan-associated protein